MWDVGLYSGGLECTKALKTGKHDAAAIIRVWLEFMVGNENNHI